ncbi:MAG TPA: cobalamin-independent methionine synthase II family protein [Stellaceae bacterium]|nr:cobalamin-independent methionine synthase II family protein [Stellaceae bacterium]
MLRSTDRILTTHAGSLPRPADWLALCQRRETADPQRLAARGRQAVADIVKQQLALGLDIISDGEQGKPSFVSYVNSRLGGFEPDGLRVSPWGGSREVQSFPEYYEALARANTGGAGGAAQMVCTGPITYRGEAELRADIDNFKAALAGTDCLEGFMPAISPANIEDWHKNRYYRDEEEYLYAIAEAMNHEYRAIVDAGFLLQIDDPRLATYYVLNPAASVADCRKWAEIRVAALNHALSGIPAERVRYHTCYSINMGPRVHDMEMKDLVRIILKIRAGAYSFEAANPRHEHEWRVWETVKLPAGKSIIPGVISHTTVLVEHPDLIAERLVRFARVVGRDSVIAGADCGFATFAGSHEIHPSIVWAKVAALVDGARRASRELWPRRPAARKKKTASRRPVPKRVQRRKAG